MQSHTVILYRQTVEKLKENIEKKIQEINRSLNKLSNFMLPSEHRKRFKLPLEYYGYEGYAILLRTRAIRVQYRKVEDVDLGEWIRHLDKSYSDLYLFANKLKIAIPRIQADWTLEAIEYMSGNLRMILGDDEYERQIAPIANKPRKMIEELAGNFIETHQIKLSDLVNLLPKFEKIKAELLKQVEMIAESTNPSSQDEKKEAPTNEVQPTVVVASVQSTPNIEKPAKTIPTVSSMSFLASTWSSELHVQDETASEHTLSYRRGATG